MLTLLLLAGATYGAFQEVEPKVPQRVPELLVFHPPLTTGAEREVLSSVMDAVGSQARLTLLEDSVLETAVAAEAADGSDPRLRIYHAMRRAGAQGTWQLRFLRPLGIVQLEGFDDLQGVRASAGTKLRSIALDALSEEHRVRLDQMIAAVRGQLAERSEALARAQTTPFTEIVTWPQLDDPPQPGFRWRFQGSDAFVSYVYDGASIQKAGLAAGDQILSINGFSVESAAHLGRALGPLHANDHLELRTRRGGTLMKVSGNVEASADFIPRWQAALLGQAVSALNPQFALPTSSEDERDPPKLLIVVYDPAQAESMDGFSVLRWIRDHHPEAELALLGVAHGAGEEVLARLQQELRPDWPSLPDPDGKLSDALRVERFPSYLLVDRAGILRYRQLDETQLRPAIASL